MKMTLLVFNLIFTCLFCMAQREKVRMALPVVPQDNFRPDIDMAYVVNDEVQFSPKLRPLHKIAGAADPFYRYYWEFGDGAFSENEKPTHHYKVSGSYVVRLFATNVLDNGEPSTVAKQIPVRVAGPVSKKLPSVFFSDTDPSVKLKVNRYPKPNENIAAYLGYRNRRSENMSGSIVLFYNEQRFLRKSFSMVDKRTYNNEENSSLEHLLTQSGNPEILNRGNLADADHHRIFTRTGEVNIKNDESQSMFIPPVAARNTVSTLKKRYLDNTVFRFNNLAKGDEHYVFMTMQTLPEMIIDTNDVISMTAMMVPDDPLIQPETFELSIALVTSYDPNQMQLVQNHINYRFMGKKKELTYKVQFQNLGKGPARNISIGIALPKQLNTSTLHIDEISPHLIPCDSITFDRQSCVDTIMTADSIYLTMKNIYLPGREQNMVKSEDSTKGFITYTIRFKKRPKKIPFSSRSVIKFDNNKPIYTNNATARFVKGISPGIVAGYNMSLSQGNYSAKGPVQIGYVLAPFSPSRPYFQTEIYLALFQQEQSTTTNALTNDDLGNYVKDFSRGTVGYEIASGQRKITVTKKRNLLQLVPVHFRYNINQWFGVGAGLMGQFAFSEKTNTSAIDYLSGKKFSYINGQTYGSKQFDTTVALSSIDLKIANTSKMWTEANVASFIDLQFGRVKTGPIIGLRYYRQLRGNIPNQFFVYAGIKL